MAARERIGRIAVFSLGLALILAVAGKALEWAGIVPFLGGLIAAFGEAALVGGLADWFAVRALFAHPFGIPFPHSALIPRNRKRLTAEIRKLVVNEWLPRDVIARKIEGFDFVAQGLLPGLPVLRPHLRNLLRVAVGEVLDRIEPREVATWVAGGVAGRLDAPRIAPWLAELVRRAREQNWLEPVLREVAIRLEHWAASPTSHKVIQQRIAKAAESYREADGWKDLLLTLGEISGGFDVNHAANTIQAELRRFAIEQMHSGSPMQTMLQDGLLQIERRLRDDPTFLESVEGVLEHSDTTVSLIERVVSSLRDEARAQLDADESPWLDMAMKQADIWLARLSEDPALRERVNGWCRRVAVQQLEQHHGLLGQMVEEQMNRLSDEEVTELLQKRVGEDLNWIRLNGTFVGGLIGVVLYLAVMLIRWASG